MTMSVMGPADMALTRRLRPAFLAREPSRPVGLLHRSRRPMAAIGVSALMTFSLAAILVIAM
jgi:hypothetical protein